MSGRGERPFLSIGEVLESLKDEFPDVTISKIRFLESQGLLDPERTPASAVMTPNPICVPPETLVSDAVVLMLPADIAEPDPRDHAHSH